MILKQTIRMVEQSKAFKSFIKKHPDYYLAHCFTMLDERERKYGWELGYYSEKTDKLVVFETKPSIRMRPEDEVFKKSGIIKKLELSKVRISVSKALDICNRLLKDKYPKQVITKRIIILQRLKNQVYNITLITSSFNILNIKVDSVTGGVLQENIQSIMSLGKR